MEACFFDSVDGSRGLKGSLYEGGICVPMIARWPRHIPPETMTRQIGALSDLLPTMAEIAEPKCRKAAATASRSAPLQWAPETSGPETQEPGAPPDRRPLLYWEYYGYAPGSRPSAAALKAWYVAEAADRPPLAEETPSHACFP